MSGTVVMTPPTASNDRAVKWVNRPIQSAGVRLVLMSAFPRGLPSVAASRVHAHRQAGTPMPGSTQASGQRSTAIATKVSTANAMQMPRPMGFFASAPVNFRPVAATSPAATAPMPRSAPWATAVSATPL